MGGHGNLHATHIRNRQCCHDSKRNVRHSSETGVIILSPVAAQVDGWWHRQAMSNKSGKKAPFQSEINTIFFVALLWVKFGISTNHISEVQTVTSHLHSSAITKSLFKIPLLRLLELSGYCLTTTIYSTTNPSDHCTALQPSLKMYLSIKGGTAHIQASNVK